MSNKVFITGYDTLFDWSQEMLPAQRLETTRVSTGINGIKALGNTDTGLIVNAYNGIPIIASNNVAQDTKSRINLVDLDHMAIWALSAPRAVAHDVTTPLTLLQQGNERFASGEMVRAHQNFERRIEVARGQQPLAVVIGCADSRVPPELVFDQGIGDLFVVRVSGNVLEDAALGSIEYAVEHLGCELVVVLAHERCSAIGAVLENDDLPGHMAAFAPAIGPSVAAARNQGGNVADIAMRLNALRIAAELRASEPFLSRAIGREKLTVVAARYDLDTGAVEWLDAPSSRTPSNQ